MRLLLDIRCPHCNANHPFAEWEKLPTGRNQLTCKCGLAFSFLVGIDEESTKRCGQTIRYVEFLPIKGRKLCPETLRWTP
jgi:hypothetical protein